MRSQLALVAVSMSLGVASLSPGPGGRLAPPLVAQGTIVGTVVVAGTAFPLAYSVVSIEGQQREQFTDAQGRFTIPNVSAGNVVVRAKHIGYSPVDMPVTVQSGDTVRMRFELAKLAVQLPAINSVGRCTKPGEPKATADSAFFVLFQQVKQNAERGRLLTRSYPFRSTVARTTSREPTPTGGQVAEIESTETLTLPSERTWRYRPGNIVVEEPSTAFGTPVLSLTLPELGDFADDGFIKNHCFSYGGIEIIDGQPLVRVDFAPAAKIGDPDISGAIYLDTASFQIRRAQIALTKPTERLLQSLTAVTVVTLFRELAPGIPIMAEYTSVRTLPDVQQQRGWATVTQTFKIIDVKWLKGKP